MSHFEITPGTTTDRLAALARSVYNIAGGMPVVAKEQGRPGVLVAGGRVREAARECEALEGVFNGSPARRVTACGGEYAGIPIYASAIADADGRTVAAIGVIDTSGMLSLLEFAGTCTRLDRQVDGRRRPAK